MEKSTVQRIVAGIKRYFGLQREYVALTFAEKLTVLLTALVVGGVIALLLLLCTVFASLALSSWISSLTGSEALGYAVVALAYLLVSLLVYANRKRWIANPIADFLANTLLGNEGKDAEDGEKPL